MIHDLRWEDAEEIGQLLHEEDPDTDPLSVNFADLQQRVLDLEGFEDEAETASEAKLELIQQAWLDAYLDSMV